MSLAAGFAGGGFWNIMGWIDSLKRAFSSAGDSPRAGTKAMGDRGENLAATYLRQQGMKILQRNYRVGPGEIDIIARLGQTLVFIEVKSRAYDDPAPEDQVDGTKQHQMTKAARSYLSRFGVEPPARFDVVAVLFPPGGREPIIRHTPDAFQATF